MRSTTIPYGVYARRDLKRLTEFVLRAEKVEGPSEICIDLTSPSRLQLLNRRFRGVDRTTDVISFRHDSLPARGERRCGLLGDIAINVRQAAIQARRMQHPVRREVRLLLIHGLLHLLDYTDYKPGPRRRMFQRQNVLLRRWESRS